MSLSKNNLYMDSTTDLDIPDIPDLEESFEIQRLKEKVKEQEKLIKKQEKKIKKLSKNNEKKENIEYIKYKNFFILEDIIKHLEIFSNYVRNDKIKYKIYGNFFQNLMTDRSLNNSRINIFLSNYNIERLEALCDIYYSLNKIKNKDDYNLINCYIREDEVIIRYYKLELIVDNISSITFMFHDTSHLYECDTTSENICITVNGIQNIYDKGNNNIYSSKSEFDILMNLFLLKNKRTNLTYNKNNKKLLNNHSLIESMKTQLEYERKEINIDNLFFYTMQDCPICLESKKCFKLDCNHNFCMECIENHLGNINYENKNCPLCRGEMKLK